MGMLPGPVGETPAENQNLNSVPEHISSMTIPKKIIHSLTNREMRKTKHHENKNFTFWNAVVGHDSIRTDISEFGY